MCSNAGPILPPWLKVTSTFVEYVVLITIRTPPGVQMAASPRIISARAVVLSLDMTTMMTQIF